GQPTLQAPHRPQSRRGTEPPGERLWLELLRRSHNHLEKGVMAMDGQGQAGATWDGEGVPVLGGWSTCGWPGTPWMSRRWRCTSGSPSRKLFPAHGKGREGKAPSANAGNPITTRAGSRCYGDLGFDCGKRKGQSKGAAGMGMGQREWGWGWGW
uniref:Uncharacterized protein n=1 Tax=Serinus canaria TaxID=9135 RepID=A0A8C9NYE6_SERCA